MSAKTIPFSVTKYSSYLSKLSNYFFPKRKKSYFHHHFKLTGNSFSNYDTAFSIFGRGDTLSLNTSVDGFLYLHDAQSVINKFIELPDVTNTYLNRKKSNLYSKHRHTEKTGYLHLSVSDLNRVFNNTKVWPANILMKNVYTNSLSHYFKTANIAIDNFRNDENYIISDNLENFQELLSKLIPYVPFKATVQRELSIINLFDARPNQTKNFGRINPEQIKPQYWYDFSEQSKTFFSNKIYTASDNAKLVLMYLTVNLNSVYNIKHGREYYEKLNYPEAKNKIELNYFFYELIDFETFV